MKNSLILRLLVLLLFLANAPLVRAQQPAAVPGYWNVETNLTTRAYTIVRFYNGQDQLVYEENLPNCCLDFTCRKARGRRVARRLNGSLQLVLRNPAAVPAHLLATHLKLSRRIARSYASR